MMIKFLQCSVLIEIHVASHSLVINTNEVINVGIELLYHDVGNHVVPQTSSQHVFFSLHTQV